MTRADLEELLNQLAATTRYVRASGVLIREATEHMVKVSDHLKEIGDRNMAAITAVENALLQRMDGDGGAS